MVSRHQIPRLIGWTVFVSVVSVIVAAGMVRYLPSPGGVAQEVARVCAALALVWSACAAVVRLWNHGEAHGGTSRSGFATATGIVALLLGVVAAIVQSVVLAMRMIVAAEEIARCVPWAGVLDFGFGPHGLWSLGLLLVACLIWLAATGDRRLGSCVIWCGVLIAAWASLIPPALRPTVAGVYERGGTPLLLTTGLSIVLVVTVAVIGLVDRYWRRPTELLGAGETVSGSSPWPGVPVSVAVIGLGVTLLVVYHLAVPTSAARGGFRLTSLVASGSAAASAAATLLVLRRGWGAALAESGMGLASLTVCGLATLVVPSKPEGLADRYPMVFSALIFGFATCTGLWTWMATVWRGRLEQGPASATTARLIPLAKHFAFLNAALGLSVAALMAVWPRWPMIAATDDSFGRVVAGCSANLYLLLVSLWCSRRLHRAPLQILAVLAVVATAGFILARVWPFTPRFG
jgi:hypothetical protein